MNFSLRTREVKALIIGKKYTREKYTEKMIRKFYRHGVLLQLQVGWVDFADNSEVGLPLKFIAPALGKKIEHCV